MDWVLFTVVAAAAGASLVGILYGLHMMKLPLSKARRVSPYVAIEAMLVCAMLLLWTLDQTVHSRLYEYGLIFSEDWAVPYWNMLRAVFALLAVAAAAVPLAAFKAVKAKPPEPFTLNLPRVPRGVAPQLVKVSKNVEQDYVSWLETCQKTVEKPVEVATKKAKNKEKGKQPEELRQIIENTQSWMRKK